jgi:ABC-type transporter Mla subunit MlaD
VASSLRLGRANFAVEFGSMEGSIGGGGGGARREVVVVPESAARRHIVAICVTAVVFVLLIAGIIRYRYAWVFVNGPEYEAAFTEVSGLAEGADVRYAGFGVGRVRRVTIDPTDDRLVLVRFRVRRGTPIHTDTRAAAVAAGGRPASYLSLRPGSSRTGAAIPGTRLASDEGPTVEDMMHRLTLVLDRTDTLLAAAGPLAHSTFFSDFARTIARVDTFATAASRSADRWGPRLETALRRTDELIARTNLVVATLDSARPALREAPAEMVATLQESRALLTEMRTGLGQGGGIEAMMRDLATASENMARLTARLERNPASVLQKRSVAQKSAGPSLP